MNVIFYDYMIVRGGILSEGGYRRAGPDINFPNNIFLQIYREYFGQISNIIYF